MIKLFYLYRIIKKKKNPTLNGAVTIVFCFATFHELIPFISKVIAKLLM